MHASVKAVIAVRADHQVEKTGQPLRPQTVEELNRQAAALLAHVERLCGRSDIRVETVATHGEAAHVILEEARRWPADAIVMGRSSRQGPASAYIGSVTAHVIEFSDCPVVVVPYLPQDS